LAVGGALGQHGMVCCFTGGAWLMTGQAAVTKVTKCDLTMHPRQALLITVLQAWLDVLKPASIVVSVSIAVWSLGACCCHQTSSMNSTWLYWPMCSLHDG
jgi:hypothetical protein